MVQISVENLADVREKHGEDTLVIAHGVFDILHPGHLDHLETAKSLGNVVAVAIWSNEHVASRKGPERPYIDIKDRLRMVDGFSTVSYVFEVPDPEYTEGMMDPIVAAAEPDYYLLPDWDPMFGGAPFRGHDSGRTTSFVYDVSYLRKASSTTEIVNRIKNGA